MVAAGTLGEEETWEFSIVLALQCVLWASREQSEIIGVDRTLLITNGVLKFIHIRLDTASETPVYRRWIRIDGFGASLSSQ